MGRMGQGVTHQSDHVAIGMAENYHVLLIPHLMLIQRTG